MSCRRLTSGLAVLSMGLALTVSGQTEPPPETAPPADGSHLQETLEEADETLRVLDEAGVPATREDVANFLNAAAGPASPAASGGWSRVRGSLRLRAGYYQGEGRDFYGRGSLEASWLRVRIRFREYRTRLKEVSGAAEMRTGPVRLQVGAMGLVHGFGLLVGAPGRSATLAADRRFAPREAHLISWVGSADPRVLKGAAGRVKLGIWTLRYLTGQRDVGLPGGAPRTDLAQVGARGSRWGFAAAGLVEQGERSGSVTGQWKFGPVTWAFETLVKRPSPTVPVASATVVTARWDIARSAGVEGTWGMSDLALPSPLGGRPSVLPGWSGRGFAFRGFVRPGPGKFLRGLVHRGSRLDRSGERTRQDKTLVDLQAGGKIGPGLELAVRFRQTSRRLWGWLEQYPWQPPRPVGSESHAILSTLMTGAGHNYRVRLLLRTYGRTSETSPGRRSLISLGAGWHFDRRWQLRGTWVSAWGDQVDLVSAVSPTVGMVLPRHWGHWRSESLVAIQWRSGPTMVQAAWSGRRPEPEYGARLVQTFWADAEIRW